MNYTALPLADLIAGLPPEVRRDFDRARFRLALEGATDEEITAALVTFGYLVQLLTGKIPFDCWKLRSYLNMGENDRKRPNRKAKALYSGPADQ
ncbi:hypothetical protein ATHL_00755 [Anaerolinea thermolimosa]|uniref:hypothetical protein n=1 Tax=Anaerolinea thermolimosa TaxID=229919 RepID=UPI0007802F2D|nr:hypothetical protein [Anaerolinea thermolimosa]GAP05914.1 hypothetical protein ATHL_00755 [Anaerolinea thermolimosa]